MPFGFGGGSQTQLSAYTPSLRDKTAIRMIDAFGGGHLAQDIVGDLMGSRGMGAYKPGAVDFIPLVGQAFQADEAGRQMANGHPVAGAANAALAAIPAPALAKGAKAAATVLREGAAEAEKIAPKIIAYHGSPHTFDKFDIAKMGTGEGGQAYGHGLYFAENEKTARAYRDALSLPSTPQNDVTRYWLDQAGGDKDQAALLYRDFAQQSGHRGDEVERTAREIAGAPGSMYQVGINANPDHFLDWDRPLNEHPLPARQILGHLLGDSGLAEPNSYIDERVLDYTKPNGGRPPFDSRTGKTVYRQLGDKVAATQALQDAGIPGIKYLDQGSRLAGDGTRNYVVFDPSNIDILKRYGIAAAGLGGALAAGTMVGQPASQPQAASSFGF